MKKPSKKNIAIISTIIIISLIFVSVFTILTPRTYSHELSSFSSYKEFYEFLKEQGNRDVMPRMMEAADSTGNLGKTASGGFDDLSFSETNIQVEGVNEPDSVKTDGTYVYVLSGQSIFIIQATPAASAHIVSTISLSNDIWYQSFFVNDDRLVVFGESSPSYWYYSWEPRIEENIDLDDPVDSDMPTDNTRDTTPPEPGNWDDSQNDTIDITLPKPGYWNVPQVVIQVYDLSMITNPLLLTTIELEGMFVNARMIGSNIYVVASEHTHYLYRLINDVDYFKAPSITVDGFTEDISVDRIYYVDEPDNIDSLTHIVSLDVSSLGFTQKSFLIGNTQDIYMSKNHIYLVYTSYEYSFFLFDSPRVNRDQQITRIHKIQVENDEITYIASGEVPGRLVNQFSMDEHNTYFRIATTTGFIWDEENPSQNNVFILDDQLSIVSSIQDIATGEEIYSARFMGDKAYLVTFKNVDPFFTLDLSDPYDPQVLGELKIPGYSDYLHPYDDEYIIGIGKDAIASNDPNFAWFQGVKLALFNVSDFDNPTLVDTVIIGDRGTSTPVLYDHKALLFDREKQLLVLPASVHELPEREKKGEANPSAYGHFSYQGAYVYNVTPEGFSFRDRITHLNESTLSSLQNNYWYHWNTKGYVYRTLYINNVLYTISEEMLKAHQLDTLEYITEVPFK